MEITEAEWTRINTELGEAREAIVRMEERLSQTQSSLETHSHPILEQQADIAKMLALEAPQQAERIAEEVSRDVAIQTVEAIQAAAPEQDVQVIRDDEDADGRGEPESSSPGRRRLRIM